MFKYHEHCGHEKDFMSETDLDSIVEYLKELDPTPIPPYGNCYGVDINHTAAYDWFVENLLNRLRVYTQRPDLNLIFGMYTDVEQSFKIHTDIKHIPENEHNPNGKQFASFLIPVSVDYDKQKCDSNSTMVFDSKILDEPADHQDWHDLVKDINPLEHHKRLGWVDHRRYVQLGNFKWKNGDLIWWNSLYPHCGLDSNVINITSKQMLVIHTYV